MMPNNKPQYNKGLIVAYLLSNIKKKNIKFSSLVFLDNKGNIEFCLDKPIKEFDRFVMMFENMSWTEWQIYLSIQDHLVVVVGDDTTFTQMRKSKRLEDDWVGNNCNYCQEVQSYLDGIYKEEMVTKKLLNSWNGIRSR